MVDAAIPPKQPGKDVDLGTHGPLEPPPTRDEIRRQLGWDLLPQLRQPDRADRD